MPRCEDQSILATLLDHANGLCILLAWFLKSPIHIYREWRASKNGKKENQ